MGNGVNRTHKEQVGEVRLRVADVEAGASPTKDRWP